MAGAAVLSLPEVGFGSVVHASAEWRKHAIHRHRRRRVPDRQCGHCAGTTPAGDERNERPESAGRRRRQSGLCGSVAALQRHPGRVHRARGQQHPGRRLLRLHGDQYRVQPGTGGRRPLASAQPAPLEQRSMLHRRVHARLEDVWRDPPPPRLGRGAGLYEARPLRPLRQQARSAVRARGPAVGRLDRTRHAGQPVFELAQPRPPQGRPRHGREHGVGRRRDPDGLGGQSDLDGRPRLCPPVRRNPRASRLGHRRERRGGSQRPRRRRGAAPVGPGGEPDHSQPPGHLRGRHRHRIRGAAQLADQPDPVRRFQPHRGSRKRHPRRRSRRRPRSGAASRAERPGEARVSDDAARLHPRILRSGLRPRTRPVRGPDADGLGLRLEVRCGAGGPRRRHFLQPARLLRRAGIRVRGTGADRRPLPGPTG